MDKNLMEKMKSFKASKFEEGRGCRISMEKAYYSLLYVKKVNNLPLEIERNEIFTFATKMAKYLTQNGFERVSTDVYLQDDFREFVETNKEHIVSVGKDDNKIVFNAKLDLKVINYELSFLPLEALEFLFSINESARKKFNTNPNTKPNADTNPNLKSKTKTK